MQALAFSNNDMAIIAWTFDGRLEGCLGFAIHRIDVDTGSEASLPAMATFPGQQARPGRSTEDAPVQKFFWKDVYAKRGGTYRYRVVAMGGKPGALRPLPVEPLLSNAVELTPHRGIVSAYFNRGILATQATARALDDRPAGSSRVDALLSKITVVGDPLRKRLAGQMVEALTALPIEAVKAKADMLLALYEFQDPELLRHFAALKAHGRLILSNMPSGTKKAGDHTDDTYAAGRQQMKDAGLEVADRFMAGNHIGHNKFQVLVRDTPQAVLLGSTNCTSNALCAQTNNTIVARSPGMAQAYADYWERLLRDTRGGKARQAAALRGADAKPLSVELEDGSGMVDLWFSPNTPKARARSPGPDEPMPPDLRQVFDIIAGARHAILFLVFQPGKPSVIDAIAAALRKDPKLFVRGAVTDAGASGRFYTAVHGGDPDALPARKRGDPPLPEDYRVIHTRGVTADDAFGQWEAELNQAGHAVIHDKIVVVDPFSDDCAVVTGSHNLGYKASYNNDENLAVFRGHRALAQAYAAHCLDVYDHYAWRYWLQRDADEAWHFLAGDDSWQDRYFSAQGQVKSAELAFWLSAAQAAP